MADSDIEGDDGDYCAGERQNDLEEGGEFACAVDSGGLVKLLRNVGLIEGARDYHVIDAHCRRDYQRPARVEQAELFDEYISRDHAAAEVHREDEVAHDGALALDAAPGHGVGAGDGDDERVYRADGGVDDGVEISCPDGLLLEHIAVRIQRESLDIQEYLAAKHAVGVAEGDDDRVIQRVEHDHNNDEHDYHVYGIEYAVSPGFVYAYGVFVVARKLEGLFHMILSFPFTDHHSEVSLSFPAMVLTMTSTITFTTELNSPIAVV